MSPLPTGRALIDAEKILMDAGLSAGETYADFGSGTIGHFVLPGSAIVGPTGKVYAVDVLRDALGAVESRARAEGAVNLTTVWGDLEHEKGTSAIPQHSVDLVSMVNVTGLLTKNPNVLKNVVRVLKGGGRLLLVDWKRVATPIGPPLERRHAPEEFKPVLDAAGFHLTKEFAAGPYHWGLLFKK